MRVLITGAFGFIGTNLSLYFQERPEVQIVSFSRDQDVDELPDLLVGVDWVFHLAGVNRPKTEAEFFAGNVGLTECLCTAIKASGRQIPVVFASSIQANLDNGYGASKMSAEGVLQNLHNETKNPVFIYRLPNIFGKFASPNYNSVVATFCYNIARELPININDPSKSLSLAYVDDVVESFVGLMSEEIREVVRYVDVAPIFTISLGALAAQLYRFHKSRLNLVTEPVGNGFLRALYATYMSYIPSQCFAYDLPQHKDERGVFVEILKTKESGQFSFFSAHPGYTRGGHYHNSKTEKFLVLKGKAQFCFRHLITNEFSEVITTGDVPQVVETVPGWTHDVTNIGDVELICLVWVNEIFDRAKPDTYPRSVRIGT